MKPAWTRFWYAGAFTVGLALAAAPLTAANGSSDAKAVPLAPLMGLHKAERIAGHYIVVLKDSSSKASVRSAAATARAAGGTVEFTYHAALKGFSAKLSPAALRVVRSTSSVKYVEADARVHLTSKQVNPPSWGLDRVDQRNLPLNKKYKYISGAGSGVTAYGIDTGIRFTHTDFGGRASSGFDAVDGGSADDCNGHGTHTAGTMGGEKYGVAKKVKIVAVRVLDCGGSGTWAGVIAGINWVTANHSGPSVANMSLGGSHTQSVDDAVTASINSGVVYAVSAGNNNTNACTQSPASTPLAVTVGATETTDARASYSNYGTCLDLFAPGSGITSDWSTSDTATNTISGTSMATPHVAGTAALYLSLHPSATPQQVRDAIVNNATNGKVTNPGTGSPNKLLWSMVKKFV